MHAPHKQRPLSIGIFLTLRLALRRADVGSKQPLEPPRCNPRVAHGHRRIAVAKIDFGYPELLEVFREMRARAVDAGIIPRVTISVNFSGDLSDPK